MSIFNKYPYTDFHELNLDMILAEIKKIDVKVSTISEDILNQAAEYTDSQIALRLASVEAEFASFKLVVQSLIAGLDEKYEEFSDEIINDYNQFKALVNAQLVFTDNHIAELEAQMSNFLIAANAYTDVKVIQNNEEIITQLEKSLGLIKVTNMFTGEKVTIQELFNYLGTFHTEGAITYDDMIAKNLSYDELIAKNITYTQLVIDGKNLL